MHNQIHEVRDPVHGFVKLSKAEWDVVNCPTFQRLRDIKQLAMGHMVYPGAVHTRFEHSIGCVEVTTQMFDLLQERQKREHQQSLAEAFGLSSGAIDRARQMVRLAALLHDVGHPPFSHSGEELLQLKAKSEERLTHEDMTAALIRDTEIAGAIQDGFSGDGISPEEVIAIATKPSLAHGIDGASVPWLSFLNGVIAGELGSDRIDYLLRDAWHSGQDAGRFDHRKLLNSMALIPAPDEAEGGYRLGVDEGGWLVAEQMVVARYLMYISLYFHKTKRIYEIHLEHFMREWLKKTTGHPFLPAEPKAYARLSDSHINAAIASAAVDSEAAGHLHALPFVDRSHLRLAREVVLRDCCIESEPKEGKQRVPDEKKFSLLKKHVRDTIIGVELVFDTPSHASTSMFGPNPGPILVLLNNKTRYLEDISEIVSGIASKIWRGRIYGPAEKRDKIRSICDNFLNKPDCDKGS